MTTPTARATFRTHYLLGFLACAGLLAFAVYLQLHEGLEPCPLCIFQRIAFAALAVVFLAGALHAPAGRGGRRGYGVAAVVAGLVGVGIAGRHVWLQMNPPPIPSCGAGLEFMRETMSTSNVIRKVLTGSGDCGTVDWAFLGLSMPAWSLVWFVLLTGWAAYVAFRR